jgi:hypothetical protein
MKLIKKMAAVVFFSCLMALSLRADILFEDSTYYPYTNGCIEGQGLWYCSYPATPILDALVTNDVLILNSTNKDSVAAPTNGFVNLSQVNYASFTINVSQLPSTQIGSYFCEFQDTNGDSDCHVFIDTIGTTVPGTYHLGIANYSTTFNSTQPPINYPLDLATGITYTVVILFDNNQDDPLVGATLWINPSLTDYYDAVAAPESPNGFVYGTDIGSTAQNNITNSEIELSPYVNAGISNVIIATTFSEVNSTNPPVIGVQPQSGTNYSGNSTTLYTAASGVDLTYQWFSSTYGKLVDDSVNIVGSTSNILVLNNLSATDIYYVVATDAYGNTATSSTATNTVITTPTAPFFPPALPGQPSIGGVNLTNSLFTAVGLTNIAMGTGPLTYQWYFAPTNLPINYSALSGQTNSFFYVSQVGYANAGSYYVVASNSVAVGSATAGPTNTITVTPPLIATLPQLHQLMGTLVTNITGANTVNVNSNGITITGYVTTFGPLTPTNDLYSEFYVGYGNSGIYVYSGAEGTNAVPAPGSYVSITGPCTVYKGQLEIDPGASNSIVVSNTVPIQMPAPQLGNFEELATNALDPNGVQIQCALVTFTNVYIYGSTKGAAYTTAGGHFKTNAATALYMTQGPYNTNTIPYNTNYIELYCPAYAGFGSMSTNLWGGIVSTNPYQVTGIMADYHGASELDLTRLQDMVTNTPAPFAAGVALTGTTPTINWPAQTGSTYSVYGATNLLGPWTRTFGLSYYPSTGTYTDTNKAPTKFYKVSTP